MRKTLLLLAVAVAALTLQVHAQTPPPACPSTTTLDDLVKAIDSAVTGPAGKDRTCFRALFLPEARLIPTARNADSGFSPHILTVDGWIEMVAKRGNASLTEHQIKVKTEVYGHLAHLWSTYETGVEVGGKVQSQVKGINSIQAVNDGKSWKIQEIVWEAETPGEAIPAKYLP
jgi:hypothetical protein